ncbi:AhpC/TSA family protein [Mucilaginibacter daejeonensis]|uniref:DUF6436 domain-containing protein n=1 Tax=Mucilaginibacter daejeonensis TaxID=398049 RepID=UPI001D173B26|nr:thioredoxin fold domain-containing protein [Mucilaginibacter daejeonensis]UEG53555.1 AhpC/TSA family protein [Mucilaginibacter daejeonensis]
MKKILAAVWLVLLASAVAALFWYNELKYQLPTPVPVDYHQVAKGTLIRLPATAQGQGDRPLFLHFFNPDCPCSRFNINMFKTLVKQYEGRINFKIVVMSKKPFTEQEIQQKFDIGIPVIFDQQVAIKCGVYSTPQAVVLDTHQRLFYRGNYNRSRYCTDERTNYARLAVDGALQQKNIKFDRYALTSYGCSLPDCKN